MGRKVFASVGKADGRQRPGTAAAGRLYGAQTASRRASEQEEVGQEQSQNVGLVILHRVGTTNFASENAFCINYVHF